MYTISGKWRARLIAIAVVAFIGIPAGLLTAWLSNR
jgi:hypothetical protein